MRSKASVTCGRDRRSADVLETRDEVCAARDEELGLHSSCDGGLQWFSSERNIILMSKRGFSEAFHTASPAWLASTNIAVTFVAQPVCLPASRTLDRICTDCAEKLSS